MHYLGTYQKHHIDRQCAVEIEIATIKATEYHAVTKRRSNLRRKPWLLVWRSQVPGSKVQTVTQNMPVFPTRD